MRLASSKVWAAGLVAACCLSFAISSRPRAQAAERAEADSVDRDYSRDLDRLPPTEPDKALGTFEIEPGFRLELAAAEPLVTDPVAMEFDEHSRLFVVEMLGYSEDAERLLGRIRLLEDADRDGRFEKSTIFAEGLAWPTAVICYDDGIFVGAAPDILYYKDVDGDGRADERRVVFTGFGVDNVQGLLNSFRWGLDNRIHVAVSRCGADVRRGDRTGAEPLVLRGRNFAFDPRTLEFEATSGASQHGFTFDPWGNAFTCSNSDHIQQILIEDRHLSANPHIRPPAVLRSIAVEGPAADVFRISSVEPWREIRTRLRVQGLVPGPVEGGGRAAGYFTSATGVTIYTGDAWPREYHGNAFIGDVGSNLVHRKLIERQRDAVPLKARRAADGREFIASRDTWFRPVQFANGPDGNLYILDMYREVIEHPASLPPVLKKHLDLTSGRDRGRIYRIVRSDATDQRRRELFSRNLPGEATTNELVAMLAHPNGWHRTTAARLLYERRDPAAVEDLKKLAAAAPRPEGRVQALYSLVNDLSPQTEAIAAALEDPDARVRRAAVALAERPGNAAALLGPEASKRRAALLNDPDLLVRYQLAFTLGQGPDPERSEWLAAIIERDVHDEYVRAAVQCSIGGQRADLVRRLLAVNGFRQAPDGRALLVELARQIGAGGSDGEVREAAVAIVATQAVEPALAGELIVPLLNGAGSRRRDVRKQMAEQVNKATERIIANLLKRSREIAADEDAEAARRSAAVAALTLGDFADSATLLAELLAPRQPQSVQLAALAVLGQFSNGDTARPVLAAWPGMSPTVRLQAAELLLSRTESAKALLAAVKDGQLSSRELDPSTIQRFRTHADAEIRTQANSLVEWAASGRTEVIESYRGALDLSGDPSRGRELFRKHCAICHRKEGFGTEVGADLATVITRTPEALVISVLDPNREVDPKYLQYTALTVDGLAKSGMIAAETATSVTLKREENMTETIPRADIEELRSTGMTLMPEGFEKVLDQQAMADLIAYLRSE